MAAEDAEASVGGRVGFEGPGARGGVVGGGEDEVSGGDDAVDLSGVSFVEGDASAGAEVPLADSSVGGGAEDESLFNGETGDVLGVAVERRDIVRGGSVGGEDADGAVVASASHDAAFLIVGECEAVDGLGVFLVYFQEPRTHILSVSRGRRRGSVSHAAHSDPLLLALFPLTVGAGSDHDARYPPCCLCWKPLPRLLPQT